MLDHLSTQAQQALNEAEAVAHRLAHDYLGTEHLLAGLAYTDEPGARRVLARCGLDGASVEAHLEAMFGRGNHTLTVRPPFTASANLALARSRWEARAFRHDAVASTHLLLALVRQGDSAATTVLRELGVDLAELESWLVEVAPLELNTTEGGGHDLASPEGAVDGAGSPPSTGEEGQPGRSGRSGAAHDRAAAHDRDLRSDPAAGDEPLAIQVVRLTHQLARLERQVAELTARLDATQTPSPAPTVP